MPRAERDARHAAHWEYADQIMKLFTAGESFRKIAAATGVPKSVVHRIVHSAADEYVTDRYGNRTTVLGRELAILDSLTRTNLRKAQDGDRDAAMIVLESSRARRRLLGLDAAFQTEITVKTAQDIEIERLMTIMKQNPADDQSPDRAETFLNL
jgi:hypothetical protein